MAAAQSVPPALTVKIVMAAVAYDRSIDDRFGDTVEVGVMGDSDNAAKLLKVLQAYSSKKLKGKPISVKSVNPADLETGTFDIVFFADDLKGDAARWADVCRKNQMTGVAPSEAGVAAGLALGVELTGSGKPKLLINLKAAKAAGANFSAQILKLARLVEDK